MLFNALGLPASTNVHINIPKKVLKKQIDDELLDIISVTNGKTQLFDVALLAPRTCHIPEYADAQYHCREIHVLTLEVNTDKKLDDLELALFKAIPYAIILIVRYQNHEQFVLSEFRTNQSDKTRYVITNIIHSEWFDISTNTHLAIYPTLSKNDLLSFYRAFANKLYIDNAKVAWPETPFDGNTARKALYLKSYYQKRLDKAIAALNAEVQIHHQLEYRQQVREYYNKIIQIPLLTQQALDEQFAQLAIDEASL